MKRNSLSLLLPAGLCGLILFSCFPLLSFWPLVFISLLPLYLSVQRLSLSRTFLAAWLAGAFFYLLLLHWIVLNPAVEGWVKPLLYLGVLLIAAYLSVYFALAVVLAKWLETKSRLPLWFWTSLTIPVFDYLRSSGLMGFPWGSLGYALVPWTSAIQMAEYTGIYGLTFWVLILNGLVFQMINKTYWAGSQIEGWSARSRILLRPALSLFLVLLLPPLWGSWRIKKMERAMSTAPQFAVAMIQGNIQQGLRWDREFQQYNFETYRDLTIKAAANKPELVIWPETALPFYLRYRPEYFFEIAALSRQTGAQILTGVPDVKLLPDGSELYFNSAFLFNSAHGFTGSYNKSHLVPFGERFPLKEKIPFLKNVSFGEGEWTAGSDQTVFKTENIVFSCLICFESIFPEISREQVQKGSQLLVNITNDGWFGRSGAAKQHAHIAVIRAVEQRRSLARCANSGVSMFVLPTGAVVLPTKLFVQTTVFSRLPLLSKKTFYNNHGDVFLSFILLLLTGAIGWFVLKRR